MEKNKSTKIIITVIVLVVAIVSLYFVLKLKQNNAGEKVLGDNTSIQNDSVEYVNNTLGFRFKLPKTWDGYSVVTQTWNGNMVDDFEKKFTGPLIIIRHPLWTAENPRQDIPIMVFTYEEWGLIKYEKLVVSAAPIGPTELGRNEGYVFALPARYNFAYPTGFEEVQQIIESRPLKGFNN